MDTIRVTELNPEQVTELYKGVMAEDFPRNERRPLAFILRAMEEGRYEALGLWENGRLLGYAFLLRQGRCYLFDYLATLSSERNRGLGRIFLAQIADHLRGRADCVIGEVEDPGHAKSEDEKALRIRRLGFYMRNGYLDTGVCCELFGVRYRLIELDLGTVHSADEIRALYKAQYDAAYPAMICRTMVKIF